MVAGAGTVRAGGLRPAGRHERHQSHGRDDATDWTCPRAAWMPIAPAGVRLHRCTSGDTTQDGTLTIAGRETVDVGGVAVRAVHERIAQDDAGAARVESANDSVIGEVTFTERHDLRRVSLEPLR